MDAAYFPEGLKRSCNLLGSTKFESSSFGIGRVHFEGQNVQEEEDEGHGEAGAEAGVSCFGEKAPGASFVTVALADFLTDFFICLHFCLTSLAAFCIC